MTLFPDPDNGFFLYDTIRTTWIGGVERANAVDVINLLLTPYGTCPEQYWAFVSKALFGCNSFRGPWTLDREAFDTLDVWQLVTLMNFVPGVVAANFRTFRAETLVRGLGGDDTLVACIKRANTKTSPQDNVKCKSKEVESRIQRQEFAVRMVLDAMRMYILD